MDQPVPPPWLETLSDEFRSRYQFRVLLGAGVTSCVYRASQASLERDVVVKLLRTEYEPDSDVAERFRREAGVLAGLRHDRVVTLLDYGTDGDVLYMVYPDVGGRSLEDHCRRRLPLAPREAVTLLADVLEGLAVIHDAGVVHRDLKPANLLVSDAGRVVLIDFGLAKTRAGHRTLTETGHIVGTPNYMPPGQIMGELPQPADDLYSLGVIAYEMLAGRNPFSAHDLTKTLQNHLTLRPEPPGRFRPEVPADLSEWVLDLLEKDAGDRPASAEVARARLVELEGVRTLPGVRIPALGGDPRDPDDPDTLAMPRRGRGPEEDAPGRTRVAVAAGVCGLAVLAGVLWPGAPGPGLAGGEGAPTPAPSPTGPPREPRGPPLPAGLVRQVEQELVQGFERRRADGERSLDNDPLAWGDVFRRLTTLRRFHDWLGAGGRPEELPAETLEEMARVDAAFQDLGFPPPFAPYRATRPVAEPIAFPEALAVGLGGGPIPAVLRAPVRGWAGAAHQAARRAEAVRAAREALFEEAVAAREWERLPERLENFLAIERLVKEGQGSHRRPLSRLFAYYDGTRTARQSLGAWMRPGGEALRAIAWATVRALEEGDGDPDGAVLRMRHWWDRFRALALHPLRYAPPEFTYGFLPAGPRGAHLEAMFLDAVLAPTLRAQRRRELGAWRRAVRPTGETTAAQLRLVDAYRFGGAAFEEVADLDGFRSFVGGGVEASRGLAAPHRQRLVRELLWVIRNKAEKSDPEARRVLARDLRGWRPVLLEGGDETLPGTLEDLISRLEGSPDSG